MTNIFLLSNGPDGWRQFLADPVKQWRDGYSAKEVAYCWEAANGLPREIAGMFPRGAELLLAIPEHKVPMPGKGLPSQCDVFALARSGGDLVAIAVEAKVSEPFGETVGEWLAKGGENRRNRVNGICDLLEIGFPPAGVRYQLLHRTAAAVVEAHKFKADVAAMVVQSFSPEHAWYEDFAAFCDHLGLGSERGALHQKKLTGGLVLAVGWASSPIRTPRQI